jgi:molecular chaperone DnaK (HSP70)
MTETNLENHDHAHSHAKTDDDSVVVGIDLGTTNSLIAVVENGVPRVLLSREGERLVSSVVTIHEGKPIVGYAARREKIRRPGETVFFGETPPRSWF